jgi:hypothetical protein
LVSIELQRVKKAKEGNMDYTECYVHSVYSGANHGFANVVEIAQRKEAGLAH